MRPRPIAYADRCPRGEPFDLEAFARAATDALSARGADVSQIEYRFDPNPGGDYTVTATAPATVGPPRRRNPLGSPPSLHVQHVSNGFLINAEHGERYRPSGMAFAVATCADSLADLVAAWAHALTDLSRTDENDPGRLVPHHGSGPAHWSPTDEEADR